MRKINWSNVKEALSNEEAVGAWALLTVAMGLLYVAGVVSIANVLWAALWPVVIATMIVARRVWKEYRRVR